MQINYLGHCYLTQKLLPLLISSGNALHPARIINVASVSHYTCTSFSFDKMNDLNSWPGYLFQYQITKFLLITYTMALADQLKEKNVVAHAVCPGFALTEFWDKYPLSQKAIAKLLGWLSIGKSASEGAQSVLLGTTSLMYY